MPNQIQQSQVIPAALAPTWEAISQMLAVQNWHPNVADVSLLTEQSSGVAASRRVTFHDGNSVVETVVEETVQGFTTMEMSEMPILKDARVTIRSTRISADETEVTFTLNYGLRYGPLGWLLNLLMMKRMFRKVFGIALSGLSYHLKTGKLVVDRVPSLAAA